MCESVLYVHEYFPYVGMQGSKCMYVCICVYICIYYAHAHAQQSFSDNNEWVWFRCENIERALPLL